MKTVTQSNEKQAVQLVYVKINANYTASVYNVNDLKRYIENNKEEVDLNLLNVSQIVGQSNELYREILKLIRPMKGLCKI